jgi:recombinational DNA repair protein RecT
MTQETAIARRDMAPPVRFRHDVASVATSHYGEQAETAEGKRIVSRFAMAFATAARASKNPDAFYGAHPASLAAAAALSLDTGLLPGGSNPEVWLIPRGGELQWMPSHRGMIKLAQEAGYQVSAVPVGPSDDIEILDGQIVKLSTDPDFWPTGLADLRGVAVFVSDLATGARFTSWWLPRAAIEQRARTKGAGPVWRSWPVEMAIKTAIKYGFARGLVPVQSVALDAALSADTAAETYQTPAPQAESAAAILDVEPEPEALTRDERIAAMLMEYTEDQLADLYTTAYDEPPDGMTPREIATALIGDE